MKHPQQNQHFDSEGFAFVLKLVVVIAGFFALNHAVFAWGVPAFEVMTGRYEVAAYLDPTATTNAGDVPVRENENGSVAGEQQTRPLDESAIDIADTEPVAIELANIAKPRTSAQAYIVADIETGQVYATKNSHQPLPIASITKLMTALIANETIAASELIAVSQRAVSTYGEAGGLVAGEALPLKTMYYPLLLESSNDAATAIAEHKGERRFLNQMNRKALSVGMYHTRFADPSGLSQYNIASASDLFHLARYINEHKPFIFDITTELQKNVSSRYDDGLRSFTNNNPLLTNFSYAGGKNGYTDEARKTLLSLFDVTLDGKERTVVIVTLKSENHVADTKSLLNWLQSAT